MKEKSKFLKIFGFVVFLAVAGLALWLPRDTCVVGGSQCDAGYNCAKGARPPFSQGYCVEAHGEAIGVFQLPIEQPMGVICTQSSQNPDGSHGYVNTLFALDLSSPLDAMPGVILAGRAGTVIYVNSDCVDPGTTTDNSDGCGDGFGNYVIVDHGDKTVAFYAHLSKVEVREKDVLSEGTVIGLEGITGNAGHRHLHFSIHYKSALPFIGGIAWPSIPYRLKFVVDGEQKELRVSDIVCRHNDFNQARWLRFPDATPAPMAAP